jgi:ABC-type sugar transport system permease subunit
MFRTKRIIWLLVPALLLYLSFFIYPAIQAIYVSLHDWSGFAKKMKFIGLGNFNELIHDKIYWQTLGNTLMILLIGGVIIFVLAFLLTSFFTTGIKGKKFFRAVIFYPNVVAPIALATFWSFLYNPRFGLINGFLRLIHLDILAKTWTGPDIIFWSVLVALIWTYIGFYMIILLSGAEKIPQDLYEVGKIEGANRFQMFFKVTVPLIWDVLTVAVVLWIIESIKLFEFLFAFSGGTQVPQQIWTNAVYMFLLSFGKRTAIFRLGYATSIAVTLLMLIIIFTGIVRLVMRRERVEY